MNYDQKSQEAETKTREFNTVSDELSQKQSQLNTIQSDLQAIRESSSHQKKRVNEMLRSLLTDLGKDGEKRFTVFVCWPSFSKVIKFSFNFLSNLPISQPSPSRKKRTKRSRAI